MNAAVLEIDLSQFTDADSGRADRRALAGVLQLPSEIRVFVRVGSRCLTSLDAVRVLQPLMSADRLELHATSVEALRMWTQVINNHNSLWDGLE